MKLLRVSIYSLCLALTVSSCVKQEFDSPPDTSKLDPNLPVNCNIRYIADRALNIVSGTYQTFGDTTIYGIVVADDHSGNFYKQLIIQDTSGGGIAILLDETTLYGDYPIGRKVYIKLKGLKLTNYNGLPEIVYDLDSATRRTSGIPASIIKNYVVKGSFPNKVVPKVITISDLFSSPNSFLNTLVQLDNMQFDLPGVVYSIADKSTTRAVSDCPFTGRMGMYNSSFSNFHSAITPSGKGSLVGIVSTFNGVQFLLRDTSDVQFTQPRECP